MRGLRSKNGNKLLAAVLVAHQRAKATHFQPAVVHITHHVICAKQIIILVADHVIVALDVGTRNGIIIHRARCNATLHILYGAVHSIGGR